MASRVKFTILVYFIYILVKIEYNIYTERDKTSLPHYENIYITK